MRRSSLHSKNVLTTGQVLYILVSVLIFPALILFLSGDFFWIEGWLFDIWFLSLSSLTIVYLYRHDPELLKERLRKPGTGNEKKWDRYFVFLLLIVFLAWIIVMPLDAKRYDWSTGFPLWMKITGAGALFPSFFLLYRSYIDNTFVSPLVRIQTERKQRVISTGVYGFVRHPMYLGAILMAVGAPMLLGSKYGLFIGIALSCLLALRIIGEEKMLVNELEGYGEYKKKVKYRLIPFVW